ncbi:hypothetical protein HDV02_005566 [Globomyces sp. JEL0801]|nr:hypothetical protein HDV02_005566 [Globomyces sp. JEL0801]
MDLDTKYYKNTVVFQCQPTHFKPIHDPQAIIIIQDQSNIESTLESLNNYESIEIKILVVLKADDYHEHILEQCIAEDFQVVYLDSEVKEIDDEDGVEQVLDSLLNHIWPCMDRKNKNGQLDRTQDKDEKVKAVVDDSKMFDLPHFRSTLDVLDIHDDLFGNLDETNELVDFETTLMKLKSIKERGMNLEIEDRHRLAEQVALAFGLALNDSDDE